MVAGPGAHVDDAARRLPATDRGHRLGGDPPRQRREVPGAKDLLAGANHGQGVAGGPPHVTGVEQRHVPLPGDLEAVTGGASQHAVRQGELLRAVGTRQEGHDVGDHGVMLCPAGHGRGGQGGGRPVPRRHPGDRLRWVAVSSRWIPTHCQSRGRSIRQRPLPQAATTSGGAPRCESIAPAYHPRHHGVE